MAKARWRRSVRRASASGSGGLGWKGRAGIKIGARCTRMERVQCGGGAKGIHAAGRAPSRPDKGQQGRFVKPA